MTREGDGRDAKRRVEVVDIEGKRTLQITGKWLTGSGKGWAVGFCLSRNSRGWVSLTRKVSDHTLNLLPNLFFPEKSIRIIGFRIVGVLLQVNYFNTKN
jgi:hypothetical protein